MFKPRRHNTCESCNEFGVYSQATAPHTFLVRTTTFRGIGSDLEVVQYVCAQCREEWLYTEDGPNPGWSLRRAMPNEHEPLAERRRVSRPDGSKRRDRHA